MKDLDQQPGGTFKWGGKYHENGDDRDTLFTDLGVFENFNPSLLKFLLLRQLLRRLRSTKSILLHLVLQ